MSVEMKASSPFVTLRQPVELTDVQLQQLSKLDAYPFTKVRAKLLSQEVIETTSVDEAISEYKKFLTLLVLYPGTPVAMISPVVDEVWHTSILFTRDYTEFCLDVFGRFIHHNPATELNPIPQNHGGNFVKLYRETFGELPKIWGYNTNDCNTICQANCDNDPIACSPLGIIPGKATRECEAEPVCEPPCTVH